MPIWLLVLCDIFLNWFVFLPYYLPLSSRSYLFCFNKPAPLPGLAAQGIDPQTGQFVDGYVVSTLSFFLWRDTGRQTMLMLSETLDLGRWFGQLLWIFNQACQTFQHAGQLVRRYLGDGCRFFDQESFENINCGTACLSSRFWFQ